MFKNKKIEEVQQWHGQKISFASDSSPEAWKHYKKYYKKNGECMLGEYNFKKLFFYNLYNDVGLKYGLNKNNCVWLNYINNHKNKYNRLFALNNNTVLESRGNMKSVKGSDKYDRLDVFVHLLSEYFNDPSNITNFSSSKNKEAAISYLNSFKNIVLKIFMIIWKKYIL